MTGLAQNGDPATSSHALPDEAHARAALVLALRQRGVSAHNVLAAIERLPRRLFLSARHHGLAYEDAFLPIECGQMVSSPSLAAFTVQALELEKHHAVLEIGTGSGYQAALMGLLAARVETLDRYATLSDLATRRFAALKLDNVTARQVDGVEGYKSKGPYDRIVATAAVSEIPESWFQQLKPGGILIAPIGNACSPQTLTRFRNVDGALKSNALQIVRTVVLQPGKAQKL